MMKVIVIGSCALLLWLGVVKQNVMTVDTARAKELALKPSRAVCDEAERVILYRIRTNMGDHQETHRAILQACEHVR